MMVSFSQFLLSGSAGKILAFALATSAAVALAQSAAPARAEAPVTFNREIAPIIFHNCVACHRPGEAGPFPLRTYEEVHSHARQIAAVTRRRFMPPWLPESGDLKFADQRGLTDEQITLIERWVDQGAMEGESPLPPLPPFAEGWQLGKPDMIVQAAKPLHVPASGTDIYWNFVLRLPLESPRWVKAVEIHPGDKRLVHHANILVDRTQSARRREEEPGAGFGGMEIRIEAETFEPDSHFLFWKPGTVGAAEPDGMALRFDKGTDLVLNTHLQPSGKPEIIQPSIGLYFTDQPATLHPMLLQMENDARLDIPPGERNFAVTDDFTLPLDVDLLAIYPHAHYLGKDMLALATLPDKSTKTLIHIKRWDLNWQAVYRYAAPVFLPRGTTISMRYSYDNSADNQANPHHPPQRVMGGNRSSDEMAHLWLQVLPRGAEAQGDPRMVLQEALARHNVEKNPADFEAHYNLASMLQARNQLDEATAQYEAALRIRPDDAVANNAFGGLLAATGHGDEAAARFAAALKSRPDYFDAHYDLGIVLATQGDYRGAIEHFSAAVRLNPEDAAAEANLGSALALAEQLPEAKLHLEKALQLDPQNTLARENLEQLRERR